MDTTRPKTSDSSSAAGAAAAPPAPEPRTDDALTGEHRGTPATGRMLSLDAFRGVTIAGMILVNNPGSWESIYWPLEHAAWHGLTPTDLVFPFFLFIVGVSITLALARRAEAGGSQRDLYLKIVRRTLLIFGLGLFLAGFPYYNLATIRIPGVLQRIAVCYLIASVIFLKTNWKGQAAIAAGLLLAYWPLMTLVPVPGFGAGDLSMEGNLAAYVDRTVLGAHTWKPLYDPEGILSTIPAIATALFGVLAGHVLRSRQTPAEKAAALFVAGAAGMAVGWAWGGVFPVNKALWTSSYTVLTAGLALQFLAFCYWLIDIKGVRRWAAPFLAFGSNALAIYFLAEMWPRVAGLIHVGGTSLEGFIYERAFASWASPLNASLLFAICTVLVWLAVATVLYRKQIFIKV
jgi:predicted acyltransferase